MQPPAKTLEKQATIVSKADTEEIVEVVNDALTEDELKEYILSETKKEIHKIADEVLKLRLKDVQKKSQISET